MIINIQSYFYFSKLEIETIKNTGSVSSFGFGDNFLENNESNYNENAEYMLVKNINKELTFKIQKFPNIPISIIN